MESATLFTAVVVGLGNIGYRYDKTGQNRITTHAKAFSAHNGFKLLAGVDISPAACEDFQNQYELPVFQHLNAFYEHASADVIALAVPTNQHFEFFNMALAHKPKAILCEKPIAATPAQARHMINAAQAAGVILAVNYIRPFEPATAAMINRIRHKAFGEIQKGCVRYVKGLANNASHYINLLLHIWGAPSAIELIHAGKPHLEDPEPDFVLCWGNNRIYFLALDDRYYSVSEFELWGSAGAVYYRNMGREIVYADVADNSAFSGYKSLHLQQTQETDLMRYQWYCVDHLYQQLCAAEKSYENAETAWQTLLVVEHLNTLLQRPPL